MSRARGVALVTGGGSGIGRAAASRLAAEGFDVVLAGRSERRLEDARSTVPGARIVAADVRDPASVDRLVAEAGAVSVLVNAAGVVVAQPVAEFDVAAFDDVVATNLRGPFLLLRAVLPGMRERGEGVVVNVGSVAARTAFPGMAAYAAAKAGLAALGAVVRAEHRDAGIRVCDVVAGATDTEIWDDLWPDAPRERMMAADDVADAVWLAVSGPGRATIEEVVIRPVGGDL